MGLATGLGASRAEPRPAADRLQRPLLRRSRFQRRLRPSVRCHRHTGTAKTKGIPRRKAFQDEKHSKTKGIQDKRHFKTKGMAKIQDMAWLPTGQSHGSQPPQW